MNKDKYLNKLSTIIERLENNHHKWYVIALTILLSWITVVSTVWLCDVWIIRTILILFTSIFFLFAEFISVMNSNKYLLMGRCYRQIEREALNNEKLKIDFDWKAKAKTNNKKGFVQWTGYLFIGMIITFAISLIIISVLFGVGVVGYAW